MTLQVKRDVLAAMIDHARRERPVEACGYLAERDGHVVEAYELRNVDASNEHYALNPQDQFNAVRQMREGGQRPRAVYHSHPASRAVPSPEDIRLAFDPNISYVIVSLAEDEPTVCSYTIREQIAVEEPIEVS